MSASKATLITHPIRSRICATLMARQLTTHQIAHLLPDVPLPSLYRHIRVLAEAGIIAPVEEVRVNGVLSKVYAVQKGQTTIAPAEKDEADSAEHLQMFLSFLNTLAESFRVYLEQADFDPTKDPIHSLMGSLTLSMAEYHQFCDELHTFLKPWCDRPLTDDRRRILFAHIALPELPDPPLS